MATTAHLPPLAGSHARPLTARVAAAGLAVGVLDALLAMGVYSWWYDLAPPHRIWQGVAGALLGRAALDGGATTVALGLLMHFGIALGWAAVFGVLHARWATLARLTSGVPGALLVAAVYGPLVWLAMNHVLVPLTQARPQQAFGKFWWIQLVGHAVVVGVPIAWIVGRRRRA